MINKTAKLFMIGLQTVLYNPSFLLNLKKSPINHNIVRYFQTTSSYSFLDLPLPNKPATLNTLHLMALAL